MTDPASNKFIQGLLANPVVVPEEALRDQIVQGLINYFESDRVDCSVLTDLRAKVSLFTGHEPRSRLHPNMQRLDGAKISDRVGFFRQTLILKSLEYVGIGRRNKVDVLGIHGAMAIDLIIFQQLSKAPVFERAFESSGMPSLPSIDHGTTMSADVLKKNFLGVDEASTESNLPTPPKPSPAVASSLVDAAYALLLDLLHAKVDFASARDAIHVAMSAKGMSPPFADASKGFLGHLATTPSLGAPLDGAGQRAAAQFLASIPRRQFKRIPFAQRVSLTLSGLGIDDVTGPELFGPSRWDRLVSMLKTPCSWRRALQSLFGSIWNR